MARYGYPSIYISHRRQVQSWSVPQHLIKYEMVTYRILIFLAALQNVCNTHGKSMVKSETFTVVNNGYF